MTLKEFVYFYFIFSRSSPGPRIFFIRYFVHITGPVHTTPFSNENGVFLLRFQRFASTLIVFVSFSPVHTTTPYSFWKRFHTLSAQSHMNSMHAHFNMSASEIGAKLKPHDNVCPPFWIVTVGCSGTRSCLFCWRHRFQIASFFVHTRKRFQKASFSNHSTLESVFGWLRFRWSFSAL